MLQVGDNIAFEDDIELYDLKEWKGNSLYDLVETEWGPIDYDCRTHGYNGMEYWKWVDGNLQKVG